MTLRVPNVTTSRGMPRELARLMAYGNNVEEAIDFSASAPKSDSVVTQFPFSSIGLLLTGSTASPSSAAINPLGPFALVNNLRIAVAGNRPLVSVRGHQLPYIHRVLNGEPGYEFEPSGAGWNQGFKAYAEIPFDVGNYISLLDASGSSLEIQVDWAATSAYLTGLTLSNCKLKPIPQVVMGGAPGAVGGVESGELSYLVRKIASSSYTVSGATNDFRIDLNTGRAFEGLMLMAFTDNALTDAVIEEVTLHRAGQTIRRMTADEIKVMNHSKHRLSDGFAWTGIYDLPFVREAHPEDVLTIDRNQAMYLSLKVANPSGANRVELVQTYLTEGFGD